MLPRAGLDPSSLPPLRQGLCLPVLPAPAPQALGPFPADAAPHWSLPPSPTRLLEETHSRPLSKVGIGPSGSAASWCPRTDWALGPQWAHSGALLCGAGKGTRGRSRVPSTRQVYITVLDENDNSPRFDFTSDSAVSVPEDCPVGQRVATVKAHDPDAGSNGQVGIGLLSQ